MRKKKKSGQSESEMFRATGLHLTDAELKEHRDGMDQRTAADKEPLTVIGIEICGDDIGTHQVIRIDDIVQVRAVQSRDNVRILTKAGHVYVANESLKSFCLRCGWLEDIWNPGQEPSWLKDDDEEDGSEPAQDDARPPSVPDGDKGEVPAVPEGSEGQGEGGEGG